MEPVLLLLTILAVDWLALVSPGPNFLLVTQAAVQRSRAYAMAVAFGVATGSLAWCLATALGLSTLFASCPGSMAS